MQSLDKILEYIKEKDLNVLELSRKTGISHDKLYKWRRGDGRPKFEDAQILQKYFGENLEEKQNKEPPPQAVREPSPQYGPSTRLLEEMVELLKKQNEYLQSQVNASLKALAASQDILLAHSKASLDWEASKFGKNQAQIDKVRFELSKLVHEHLKALKEEGTTIGMGK